VEVDMIGQGTMRDIKCLWDRALTVDDELFYATTILPIIVRRSKECLELVGLALVVLA
jgi:hypothetical protein